MSGQIDFQERITSIQRVMEIAEYSTAATECVKISEQALRRVVRDGLGQVSDEVQEKVREAVRKRDRRNGGIESLTMGQLVHVLRESGFLNAWAEVSGNRISSLQAIDLEKLTRLRNQVMHEAAETTRTETEFLLHCLKVILVLFQG